MEKLKRGWPFGLLLITVLALAAAIVVLPIPEGDDWETFYGTTQRLLAGESIYGEKVTHSFFYNPPWLAVLLAPAGLLPFRWGLGLLTAASLVVGTLLARNYRMSRIKLLCFLLSPPMFYTLLHGQIDALVLGGVLLPQEWWLMVGLTKPQTAIGLALGIRRELWTRAALITAILLGLSFLLFGFWPLVILQQEPPAGSHNVWMGFWPFQVPVGVALLLWGAQRKDERILLSASPFFLPYAAISSFLGPWMALCSMLKRDWQVGLVFLSFWAAVLYRMVD